MNAGDFFGKYIGILGVVTLTLVAGYVIAPFAGVTLPEGYTQITLLCVGAYAGKNGTQVASSLKSKVGV